MASYHITITAVGPHPDGTVEVSHSFLELSPIQVAEIGRCRNVPIAKWVKDCCELDLDVLSTVQPEPDYDRFQPTGV